MPAQGTLNCALLSASQAGCVPFPCPPAARPSSPLIPVPLVWTAVAAWARAGMVPRLSSRSGVLRKTVKPGCCMQPAGHFI